jgi:hypothetical protein
MDRAAGKRTMDQLKSDPPTRIGFEHSQPDDSQLEKRSTILRIAKLLSSFLVGQVAMQTVSVCIGLYLVRFLSVSAYAQYGFALAFQATTSTLMDLGYAGTIIPLVGDRVHDRALIGAYVKAAKSLRDRAYWVMTPIFSAVFLIVTYRQHWSWMTQVFLLGSVLLSLYSSGSVSYFSAALILRGKLKRYYAPQTVSGCCRLAAYALLNATRQLNSWTAAGLSALNVTVNAFLLGREAKKDIDWPAHKVPELEQEIKRYILPALPAILLGAFHGQIALFLISVSGSAVNIAQVAALGRIGQLFAVMMSFNVVLIEPYIARLPKERLAIAYVRFIAVALAGSGLIVLAAFRFPEVFLWIIGPKYRQLRQFIGWVILTACINYVAGLIWIMNRSRKWLFWRGTILEILVLAVVQIVYVATVGVASTGKAVFFNFASSFCYVIAHIYVATVGFLKDTRGDAAYNSTYLRPLSGEAEDET